MKDKLRYIIPFIITFILALISFYEVWGGGKIEAANTTMKKTYEECVIFNETGFFNGKEVENDEVVREICEIVVEEARTKVDANYLLMAVMENGNISGGLFPVLITSMFTLIYVITFLEQMNFSKRKIRYSYKDILMKTSLSILVGPIFIVSLYLISIFNSWNFIFDTEVFYNNPLYIVELLIMSILTGMLFQNISVFTYKNCKNNITRILSAVGIYVLLVYAMCYGVDMVFGTLLKDSDFLSSMYIINNFNSGMYKDSFLLMLLCNIVYYALGILIIKKSFKEKKKVKNK